MSSYFFVLKYILSWFWLFSKSLNSMKLIVLVLGAYHRWKFLLLSFSCWGLTLKWHQGFVTIGKMEGVGTNVSQRTDKRFIKTILQDKSCNRSRTPKNNLFRFFLLKLKIMNWKKNWAAAAEAWFCFAKIFLEWNNGTEDFHSFFFLRPLWSS